MARFRVVFASILSLLTVLTPGSFAESRPGNSSLALQAPVSENGLVVLTRGRRAEVVQGGDSVSSIRLQRDERLEAVEETSAGFVVAGVSDDDVSSTLLLIESDPMGTRRLASLPKRDLLQLRPVPLVERGMLVGAAWLEGPDPRRLRVKTADWDGAEWGPVMTVSRRSPGSQTGLTGTVMRDGRALLVWSQFDGQDDDLFFSSREGSGWTRPERVSGNNSVPDITPAISFTRRGALLAWSRFDGSDYRLWVSNFERGRWTTERLIGAPGTLFPQVLRRGEETFTIFRSVQPRGWSVLQTNDKGEPGSRAFVASTAQRPILTGAGHGSVTLAWPQTGQEITRRLEVVP